MSHHISTDKLYPESQLYALEIERKRLESILREGETQHKKSLRKMLMLVLYFTAIIGVTSGAKIFATFVGTFLYIATVILIVSSTVILFSCNLFDLRRARKQLRQWEEISNDCKDQIGRN